MTALSSGKLPPNKPPTDVTLTFSNSGDGPDGYTTNTATGSFQVTSWSGSFAAPTRSNTMKPTEGMKSSEFIVAVLGSGVALFSERLGLGLTPDQQASIVTWLWSGYILSRGIRKHGTAAK